MPLKMGRTVDFYLAYDRHSHWGSVCVCACTKFESVSLMGHDYFCGFRETNGPEHIADVGSDFTFDRLKISNLKSG